jgi:NADH:ubiquinone oxidoreductase subunit K
VSSDPARLLSIYGVGVFLVLVVGFSCLLRTRNLVRALIGVEVLAKAVTLLIIVAGYVTGRVALAQALAITLIVVEVAVIVVGVGIVLCIYQHSTSLDTTQLRNLWG